MAVDKSTVSESSVSDELHAKNAALNPETPVGETKDDQNKTAEDKVKEHADDAKVVDTKLGTSPEEKAADRAGVPEDRLENPKQNREPKNKFEKQNQKDTDAVRKAAQKESNLSTEAREDKAETPNETAKNDATKTTEVNQGSEIAQAIRDGLAGQKDEKNIVISTDDSVTPRFTVGLGANGEPLIRENETGVISQVQLKSLEEKEADLQNAEFNEL